MQITRLYMASSPVTSCGFLPTGELRNLLLKRSPGFSDFHKSCRMGNRCCTLPLPVAAQTKIMVQSLKSGEPKELFAGLTARYLPTGHIVYKLPNNNNLFAIPFDLDRLEVQVDRFPVVEGVRQYAISDSGTLVYIPGTAAAAAPGQRTLVWVDRKGKEEPLAAAPNDYRIPRISPDGTRVALSR